MAKELNLSPSTVSEGVAKLTAKGLLRHAPYGGISLTEEGRAQAVRMVRIHRLLETGLVELFGYSWDEVHDEAELLEHAVSDRFIERLDRALGHPRKDPHGDTIPTASGEIIEDHDSILLSELDAGMKGRVDRVSDRDSDVLVYLDELGLVPGALVSVDRIRKGAGIMDLTVSPDCAAHTCTEQNLVQVSLASARAVAVHIEAEHL